MHILRITFPLQYWVQEASVDLYNQIYADTTGMVLARALFVPPETPV